VMGERKREGQRKVLVSVARRVRPAAVVMLAWGMSAMDGRSNVVVDYNDGTTAYENGEFEAAAEKLKASLSTQDIGIQGKAYYNLGNSLYRVGQGLMQEEPKKTIETWERSVKAFEDALALNDADEDAEFNRDFVQKKLDELKEQQPQDQEEEDQENKEEEDEQEKEDEQESEDSEDGEGESEENQDGEQKEGEEGEEQSGENGEEQKGEDGEQSEQDQEGGEEESEDEGAKGQEDKSAGKPEEPAEGDPGDAREDEQGSQEGEQGEAGEMSEARKEGEMSREEAIRLLESLANDERIVIPAPLSEQNAERRKGRNAKEKTW